MGTEREAFAQVPHLQWFVSEAIITVAMVLGFFYPIAPADWMRPLSSLAPSSAYWWSGRWPTTRRCR